MQDAFMHHFTSGVHYELVQYDLSDLATRTKALLEEAQANPQRLERMAAAAMEVAINRFHKGAILNTLAWSMMRAKKACNWEVKPPHEEAGWVPHVAFREHMSHWQSKAWLMEASLTQLLENIKTWYEGQAAAG
jgi:hypothetical protein